MLARLVAEHECSKSTRLVALELLTNSTKLLTDGLSCSPLIEKSCPNALAFIIWESGISMPSVE